ncbi:MAG: ammonia-forming cytochrome c nitrite reductase subunit c552 [Bacteroidales bacterium]|nr:ammonia-forming cytochrome c nitrite reductase subunit c552 [Bacteroidales bacterium]
MKRFSIFSVFLPAFIIMAMIVLFSCTKEGPPGKDGSDGEDGINGNDGTATCAVCHNISENVYAKTLQWQNSLHATGGNFERNTTQCAPCHTSKGFREVIHTGMQVTAAAIPDPTPINCYTCHKIHETYTTEDWDLRLEGPVTFWASGLVSNQGSANTCIQCHQPRPASPWPDINDPEGTINITSNRWGPHYGPQGTMIAGVGAFEFGGGYSSHAHSQIDNSCVTCHMADAFAAKAGGHTNNMRYVYQGSERLNTTGCIDCHSGTQDELTAAVASLKTEIQALLSALEEKLTEAGIYNPNTGLANPGTYPNKVVGAYYNFLFCGKYDRSYGMHNKTYAKSLLENSIAALN